MLVVYGKRRFASLQGAVRQDFTASVAAVLVCLFPQTAFAEGYAFLKAELAQCHLSGGFKASNATQ
ncbi:hypothetical protein MCERH10_01236 [Caulobacteraceae bacterium]